MSFLEKTLGLIESGELVEAERVCLDHMVVPDCAFFANLLLAIVNVRVERPERADALFRRAVSHAPQKGIAYFQRAGELLSRGRFDDALRCARNGCAIDPNDQDMQRLYAGALLARFGPERFLAEAARQDRWSAEWVGYLGAASRMVIEADHRLPSVLINALPRSASTYIRNALIDSYGYREYRCFSSDGGQFADLVPSLFAGMRRGGLITRAHLAFTSYNLDLLRAGGLEKAVFLLRDPRAAFYSFCHRVLYNPRVAGEFEELKAKFPALAAAGTDGERMSVLLDIHYERIVEWTARWLDHISKDTAVRWHVLFYMDFVKDSASEMARIADFYGLDHSAIRLPEKSHKNNYVFGGRNGWRERLGGETIDRMNERLRQRMPGAVAARWLDAAPV